MLIKKANFCYSSLLTDTLVKYTYYCALYTRGIAIRRSCLLREWGSKVLWYSRVQQSSGAMFWNLRCCRRQLYSYSPI